MAHSDRPFRSVLYLPGSKPRALEKARGLPADALILDLEDSLPPGEKPRARAQRAVCRQGRAMGFDGKSLVHPDQIPVANEIFAPRPDDIALAEAQLAAYEAARARGEGVAVVDGRIVESLHAEVARCTLARAAAIAALEASHAAAEAAPLAAARRGAGR